MNAMKRRIQTGMLASLLTAMTFGEAAFARTVNVKARTDADIQKAIDKLPAQGGLVLITADAPVVIQRSIVINRDNVTLAGEGQGATVLRLADGANAPVIVMGDDAATPGVTRTNIHVRDLTIDGNRGAQTSEVNPNNPALRNNGISLRRVVSCSVVRVTAFRCASGGLVAELGCRRITVSQFESYDHAFDGLAAYETEDSSFSELQLHDNLAAGLSFDLDFVRNILRGVVIAQSGSVGIFMRDSRDNEFSSIQIRDSDEHGIFLAQTDADTTTPAAGNTFHGVVISHSGGAGIRVNDLSCSNNLLSASQLISNAGGGVSEAAGGLLIVEGTIVR